MIKIFFVTSWQKDTRGMYNIYTPNHDGVWDNLRACNNRNQADIIVVMQGGMPNKDKKRTIFFQREPIAKHGDFSGAKYCGYYNNHYHVCTWWVLKKFNFLANLTPPPKDKTLSAIISGKSAYHGHKARHKLMQHYAKHHKVDWFGNGIRPNMPGYLGPLQGRCKWAGLARYRYSLAIENSSVRNYFTEKLVDCFLTFTKPIYWGCPNIADYFPEGSYAIIDIANPVEAARQINEEIQKPVDYKALAEARNLVLYKYNLWPSIARILNDT